MNVKVPSKLNIVSSPLVNVDFSFAQGLGEKINGFMDNLQAEIAQDVLMHMRPYMPMAAGALSGSLTYILPGSNNTIIHTEGPYAQYLYYGLLMVDSITGSAYSPYGGHKVNAPGDIPLKFTGAPQRGKKWDERMWAEKGEELLAGWQRFVKQNI